jgi:hypothetical protein
MPTSPQGIRCYAQQMQLQQPQRAANNIDILVIAAPDLHDV